MKFGLYRAKQANGTGRTDWVVMGPCEQCNNEENCVRCDGCREICIAVNLDEGSAKVLASCWNHNEKRIPFNGISVR